MSFMARYYDNMLAASEEACLRNWRKELLSHASGIVLEVGAGSGANLEHYSSTLPKIILSEPDAAMAQLLIKKQAALALPTSSIEAYSMDDIKLPDASVDTVVCTLVCCSVPSMADALAEVKRVLKPGGKFLFIEHVAAQGNPSRARWQNVINPVWRRLAGNCHLNRNTEQAIENAGFVFPDEIQRESMRKAMPLVRPCIRGIALKPEERTNEQ